VQLGENMSILNENKIIEDSARHKCGKGGGGSHQPSTPSFLAHNNDNVNSQLWRAKGLLTMWDFLEHKGRIGRTNILLKKKDDFKSLKIMPASCKSME
jgi:hypothetical protein